MAGCRGLRTLQAHFFFFFRLSDPRSSPAGSPPDGQLGSLIRRGGGKDSIQTSKEQQEADKREKEKKEKRTSRPAQLRTRHSGRWTMRGEEILHAPGPECLDLGCSSWTPNAPRCNKSTSPPNVQQTHGHAASPAVSPGLAPVHRWNHWAVSSVVELQQRASRALAGVVDLVFSWVSWRGQPSPARHVVPSKHGRLPDCQLTGARGEKSNGKKISDPSGPSDPSNPSNCQQSPEAGRGGEGEPAISRQ